MKYLKRLVELSVVAGLGAAVPVFADQGLSKAALYAAGSAALAAVYGVLAKGVGDPEKPSVVK